MTLYFYRRQKLKLLSVTFNKPHWWDLPNLKILDQMLKTVSEVTETIIAGSLAIAFSLFVFMVYSLVFIGAAIFLGSIFGQVFGNIIAFAAYLLVSIHLGSTFAHQKLRHHIKTQDNEKISNIEVIKTKEHYEH